MSSSSSLYLYIFGTPFPPSLIYQPSHLFLHTFSTCCIFALNPPSLPVTLCKTGLGTDSLLCDMANWGVLGLVLVGRLTSAFLACSCGMLLCCSAVKLIIKFTFACHILLWPSPILLPLSSRHERLFGENMGGGGRSLANPSFWYACVSEGTCLSMLKSYCAVKTGWTGWKISSRLVSPLHAPGRWTIHQTSLKGEKQCPSLPPPKPSSLQHMHNMHGVHVGPPHTSHYLPADTFPTHDTWHMHMHAHIGGTEHTTSHHACTHFGRKEGETFSSLLPLPPTQAVSHLFACWISGDF